MSHGIGISISLSKCIFNLTQLPYVQPKKTAGVTGFLHPAARSAAGHARPHGGAGALPQPQAARPEAEDAIPREGGRDFEPRRRREEAGN